VLPQPQLVFLKDAWGSLPGSLLVPESVDLPLHCVANRYLWAVRSSGEGWLVDELPSGSSPRLSPWEEESGSAISDGALRDTLPESGEGATPASGPAGSGPPTLPPAGLPSLRYADRCKQKE
jgi:hypothetical protein